MGIPDPPFFAIGKKQGETLILHCSLLQKTRGTPDPPFFAFLQKTTRNFDPPLYISLNKTKLFTFITWLSFNP